MNEIIEELKLSFTERERLAGRFVEFCKEFKNFEYDSTGINFDEADDIVRKAKKIASKMFFEINTNSKSFELELIEVDCFKSKIDFEVKSKNGENLSVLLIIIFDEDGFELLIPKVEKPSEENISNEKEPKNEKNEIE